MRDRQFKTVAWGIVWALMLVASLLLQAQDAPPPPPDTEPPPSEQGTPPDNNDVSFQTFYDSLAPMGTWIQSSDYGYVWQPHVSDVDWAPYTVGHWVYTDQGWTWVSDEPWGWATYHYGRWVNLDDYGWCWVPGYVWAPAWVSWRYGDDYCGWAPLPPDSFVGIDYGDNYYFDAGFHIGGDCDGFFGIGAGCYWFLPVRCLGYHNYHGYYCNRHDNYAIINHTRNVTNLNVSRNGAHSSVVAGGPSFNQVNAISQTPVQRASLVRTSQPGAGGGTFSNHSLAFYAPHISRQTSAEARPGGVSGTIGHSSINRGMEITRPLAVNQHLVPSSPTAGQIEQARQAQASAPPTAKVMTANTSFRPILSAPLTTMRPVTASGGFQGQGTPNRAGFHENVVPSNSGGTSAPKTYFSPYSGGQPGAPSHYYAPPSHSAGPAPAPSGSASGGNGFYHSGSGGGGNGGRGGGNSSGGGGHSSGGGSNGQGNGGHQGH